MFAGAVVILSAASLSAQTAPTPDSARVATLPTVTVTAESGNWLIRVDDQRRMLIDAVAENRRLANELRQHDARVVQLTIRLDSLKRVEFVQKIAIAAIDDSVAATRARRRALEARVVALETRAPQP
jgi:hypothetical protein